MGTTWKESPAWGLCTAHTVSCPSRGPIRPSSAGDMPAGPCEHAGRGQQRLRVSPGGPRATGLEFELHLLPRLPGPHSSRLGCLGVTALPTSGPHTSFQEKESFSVGDTVQGPSFAANASRSTTSGRPTQAEKERRHRPCPPTRRQEAAAARPRLTCAFIDDGRLPGPAQRHLPTGLGLL